MIMGTNSEASIKALDVSKCLICLKTINEANALLSCIHTFCEPCLNNYCSKMKTDSGIECPLCSRIFLIPPFVITSSANNFFTSQLLKKNECTEKLSPRAPNFCELCSDPEIEIPSTSHCVECDQRICDRCSVLHMKQTVSKSHQIIRVDVEEKAAESVTVSVSYCDQHPDEMKRLYCYDCKLIMCHKCMKKPDKHALSVVNESRKMFHEQLTEDVDKLSAFDCQKQRDIEQLDNDKNSFMKHADTIQSEIIRKYDQLLSLIQAHKIQLVSELNSFKEKVLKKIDEERCEIERQFAVREEFKRFCVAMMDKGTACDISRTAQDVHAGVEKLVKTPEKSESLKPSKVNIAFKPSPLTADCAKNFIGQLTLDLESKEARCDETKILTKLLEKPALLKIKNTGESVTGITVLGEYVFVVKKTSQVEAFRRSDFSLSHCLQITGSQNLASITSCSHFNCLYICDLKREIIYKYDLSDAMRNGTSSWMEKVLCHSLSVTRTDHNVLATLSNVRLVREYTTHGNLVREIRVDRSVYALRHCIQLSTGNYVLIDISRRRHQVCIVDRNGRIVQSFGGVPGGGKELMKNPYQLAVDKDDNVLVTDYANNRVRVLSPTLSLLGDIVIPSIEFLRGPDCVCVDELNGRLYIGESIHRRLVVVEF